VVASPSSSEPPAETTAPGWLRAIAGLRPIERLAGLGAVVCAASTLLPWYRAPVDDLGNTAWGSFGFALMALLITVGSALALLLQSGRGRRPPTPLHEGTLLAAAGIWSGVIIAYLMLDRPTFVLADFHQEYDLAYGEFVALAGAALLTVAGLRIRRIEALGERGRP
jgi:diadenosine tetraphosphatase ApaH/serine/threonine PP2A family protein phosphatase